MSSQENKSKKLLPKQIEELNFWITIKKHGWRGFTPEEWRIAHMHFRQYLLMYIDRHIGDLKNKTAIEVGCGPGSILPFLSNVRAIGIDPLIDEYKKLWDLSKDNVEYICSEIENLKIEVQADIVICWNVLDHVSNIKVATTKLFEMLKANGELWFMINLEDVGTSTEVLQGKPDSAHPYKVNIVSISKLLENAGFFWKEKVLTEFQINKRCPILMGVLGKGKLQE